MKRRWFWKGVLGRGSSTFKTRKLRAIEGWSWADVERGLAVAMTHGKAGSALGTLEKGGFENAWGFHCCCREKTQECVKYPCLRKGRNSKFCGTSDSSLGQKGSGRRLGCPVFSSSLPGGGPLLPQTPPSPASPTFLRCGEGALGPQLPSSSPCCLTIVFPAAFWPVLGGDGSHWGLQSLSHPPRPWQKTSPSLTCPRYCPGSPGHALSPSDSFTPRPRPVLHLAL